MKRYLAPLLILVILLLAGSSLWLRSGSVPTTDAGSQAETAATAPDGISSTEEESTVPSETKENNSIAPDRSDETTPRC